MRNLLKGPSATDAPPERAFARTGPPLTTPERRPMRIDDAQRVVLETTATRDKAEALLEALRRARSESERQMKSLGLTDKMREATGRSLYDNAIDSTRTMIDALTRCVRDAKRDLLEHDSDLTAEEQRELDELDAEVLGHDAPGHARARTTRDARTPLAPAAR